MIKVGHWPWVYDGAEALGLAWADVDLDHARLPIRQALHRVDGELRLDAVGDALDSIGTLFAVESPRRRRVVVNSDWRDAQHLGISQPFCDAARRTGGCEIPRPSSVKRNGRKRRHGR